MKSFLIIKNNKIKNKPKFYVLKKNINFQKKMKTLKNRINLKLKIPKINPTIESDLKTSKDEKNIPRNSVSKITENIYISGYLIGKDIPYLKKNNFTHVINCCSGSSLEQNKDLSNIYQENNIKYLSLFLRDDPELDIFYHFFQVINFLEKDSSLEKKILFHCVEGISRAPAMVAGYLMWKKKLKNNEVIDLLKSKRDCVDINLGFNIQLHKWENYLISLNKKKINIVDNSSHNNVVILVKE